MTATERIRAMLDERGVEWRGGLPTETMVEADGLDLLYVALSDGRVRAFIRNYLTPEQAIEATLGRGECMMSCSPEYIECKVNFFECSECGWSGAIDDTTVLSEYPRYCPNCGRKVRA